MIPSHGLLHLSEGFKVRACGVYRVYEGYIIEGSQIKGID